MSSPTPPNTAGAPFTVSSRDLRDPDEYRLNRLFQLTWQRIASLASSSSSGGSTVTIPAGFEDMAISAGNVTPNAAQFITHRVTIDVPAITIQPMTGGLNGSQHVIIVVQDATGGRTYSWDAAYQGLTGIIPPTAPNSVAAYAFSIEPGGTFQLFGYVPVLTSGLTIIVAYDDAAPTNYAQAVPRDVNVKLGDRVSVLDWGADPTGSADSTVAINKAIADAATKGDGFELYFPGGTYLVGGTGSIAVGAGAKAITFSGDGPATVLNRNGTIPAGQGIFDIQGSNGITIRDLVIDGGVTTSAGVLYSTVAGNPMLAALTANTSIWVHSGSSKFRMERVTVRHTGGYAVLIDPSVSQIQDVQLDKCTFENNRPHLFGTSGGDLNYGSWTGGVYVNGDGTVAGAGKVLRRFLVQGCTFRRGTGNCLWSHLLGLAELHEDFRFIGNSFTDCGLDGIEVAGLLNGAVSANTFRRIGYICSDDSSPSTPKYLAGANATGLDTAGLAIGVDYSDNTFDSINGGCMDCDGYASGSITGNTCRLASSGDPDYIEDQVAIMGPGGSGAITYGVQTSNSNNSSLAAIDVNIAGNTFIGMTRGSIVLFAARNCNAIGNHLIVPAVPLYPPIGLGNIGTGANQRAYGNFVGENTIVYDPGVIQPAIIEDANGHAFSGTDKNWISQNRCIGNCYEFEKDANTISTTNVTLSSNFPGLATASAHLIQSEGRGSDSSAALRWYYTNGTAAPELHMQLQGFDRIGNQSPLLNVSKSGAADTGVFATGNRTQAVFSDCIVTGKTYADSLWCLSGATFLGAEADLLADSVGLFRYVPDGGGGFKFQLSTSVAVGSRVWVDLLAAAGGPAGSNTQVQFNDVGSFGATARFTVQKNSPSVGTLAQVAVRGNIQVGDLATPGVDQNHTALGNFVWAGSAGQSRIVAESYSQLAYLVGQGARGSLGSTSYMLASDWLAIIGGSGSVPGSGGVGAFFGPTGAMLVQASENWNSGAHGTDLAFWVTPNGTSSSVFAAFLRNSMLLEVVGRAANFGVRLNAGWFLADDPVSGGFVGSGNQFNTIQAPAGGAYVGLGFTTDQALYPKSISPANPNPPAAGYAGFGHKSGSVFWYYNPITPGWATVDFAAAPGSGVTSLNGLSAAVNLLAGTGVTVATASPNITVSIGQAVGIASNVSFASVTTSGVVQSSAAGASIAFQTTGFTFQVDGNGNISSSGQVNLTGGGSSYKMSGVVMINALGQFVGSGINVGSNGVSAGGYNVAGGFIGQTWDIGFSLPFTVNGLGSFTTAHFTGGVITGAS